MGNAPMGGILAVRLLLLQACFASERVQRRTTACAPHMCTGMASEQAPCPAVSAARSDPVLVRAPHNLYFRNAAGFAADILYVSKDGEEVSQGILAPGSRRDFPTLYGDVWRVRVVKPGQAGDGVLLLEHEPSTV